MSRQPKKQVTTPLQKTQYILYFYPRDDNRFLEGYKKVVT